MQSVTNSRNQGLRWVIPSVLLGVTLSGVLGALQSSGGGDPGGGEVDCVCPLSQQFAAYRDGTTEWDDPPDFVTDWGVTLSDLELGICDLCEDVKNCSATVYCFIDVTDKPDDSNVTLIKTDSDDSSEIAREQPINATGYDQVEIEFEPAPDDGADGKSGDDGTFHYTWPFSEMCASNTPEEPEERQGSNWFTFKVWSKYPGPPKAHHMGQFQLLCDDCVGEPASGSGSGGS